MESLARMAPQQVACKEPSCRRRQSVPLTELYSVTVRGRSGGTHKEAACACRACGREIQIPPAFLRNGVLAMLPGRDEFLSVRAPAPSRTQPPQWTAGAEARAALEKALRRIRETGGHAVGLTMREGRQRTVDVPDDAEAALSALEEAGCHLMVACGPNPDGSTWQAVLHPASGAATLVSAA